MLLIFGGAGTIRSLRKELGTTTTLLVCLIVLSRWGDKILRGIDLPLGLVADASIFQGHYSPLIQSSIYEGILLSTAFLSYRFDILAFRWPDMGGLLGALLGLLVGLGMTVDVGVALGGPGVCVAVGVCVGAASVPV